MDSSKGCGWVIHRFGVESVQNPGLKTFPILEDLDESEPGHPRDFIVCDDR